MISVANRTETAARIKNAFDKGKILIEELCDPKRTLHIDSKVLTEAESRDEEEEIVSPQAEDEENGSKTLTKKQQAEHLRKTVDTVGRIGQPGEQIQNVISVGMLSEGWDAKTVTHGFAGFLESASLRAGCWTRFATNVVRNKRRWIVRR